MPDYPEDLRFLTIETYTLKELKTCSEQCIYLNWVEYKRAILIEIVKDYHSSGMSLSKVQDPFLLNLPMILSRIIGADKERIVEQNFRHLDS